MKKIICLMLCVLLLFTAAGCGGKGGSGNSSDTENSAQEKEALPKVDVDLSELSGTVVFAQVSNMLSYSDDYMGKLVKIRGKFTVYEDTNTGQLYYACVIPDATACCEQGFEFVLAEEKKFPEEYPALGSEITVSGTFDKYQEGPYVYVTLRNATLQ